MVQELIDKYVWLLQKLLDASPRGLSLAELSRRWEDRYNQVYTRRSFNNHRQAIEEIFGVEIRCRRSDNHYYIEHCEDVLQGDASTQWLINTFTVNNLLSLGRERLSGRVAVEEVPSGYRFLTEIMQALLENRKIDLTYRKYSSQEASKMTVHPYAVKEFGKRWYLVAWSEQRKAQRVYGLDRIEQLEILPEHFNLPAGYDIEEEFLESFGPYLPQGQAETILFHASPTETRYLLDLPLHPSQKMERQDETGALFSIRVIPTVNLIMEFCARGDRLEVLGPASVRSAVIQALQNSLNRYLQHEN